MNYYSLRFPLLDHTFKEICSILGPDFIGNDQTGIFEFTCDFGNDYWYCLHTILDHIQAKLSKLESIGIEKDKISLWLISEFSEQTNLEFSPDILEKLGEVGITFCISLY